MKEERFKKINKNITELIISYILTITIIGMNIWVWIAKFKYIGYSYNKIDFFEIMWIPLFLLIGVGFYFIVKSHTRVEYIGLKMMPPKFTLTPSPLRSSGNLIHVTIQFNPAKLDFDNLNNMEKK